MALTQFHSCTSVIRAFAERDKLPSETPCQLANPSRVEIDCKDMVRALSGYLDGELDADLRAGMQYHFSQCRHCRAVLVGTRNVLRLIADERSFDVPVGFSALLFPRIPR